MQRAALMSVIVWTLAGCGDSGGAAAASTTGPGGTGTEATPTGEPTTTTPPAPTTTTTDTSAPADTSLDPTNAFTDSSQLTEGPAETGEPPPPPHMCEASGQCFEPGGCVECSIGSDCADEFAACLAVPNGECTAYSDCVSGCAGDSMCQQNCYLAYPNGYDPAWALSDCSLCDVCATSCAAYGAYCVNGGGGPGKTETCDELGDCAACSGCSAFKDCAAAVQACIDEPSCQPYQSCIQACPAEDITCLGMCEAEHPAGYDAAWAQFDCAVCTACPASCASAQPYCMAGGGGPNTECLSNGDCMEIHDSLPYCVNNECVECLTDDDCFDVDFPTCTANFCG